MKTLSAIIGHISSTTTLNIYAHVRDEMRQKAADWIDQGIVGVEKNTALRKKNFWRAAVWLSVAKLWSNPV